VVGNLLGNAAKFTDPGGRVAVRLTADREARRAAVAVSDTGIGIDPELLPRLFDMFTQAERSMSRSRDGLGLGLALVRGLVELHGGGVQAASAGPGQGAEFTFWLPLADSPAAPAGEPAEEGGAGKPLRVLVVDDNRDSADSLRLLLELRGFQAAAAYTGPDGLDAARQFRPDVVLCDLQLPGLDGYAVAQALRQDPTTAHARLIALTGYGSPSDQKRCLEAGYERHLSKPVEPDELYRLLRADPSDPPDVPEREGDTFGGA
jgi:CheY-like chemotaxis protein